MNQLDLEIQTTAWPRWATWGAIIGVWTLPGLAALSFYYLNQIVTAQPMVWPYALVSTIPNWYIWALMTPAVVWLARRYRIERTNVVKVMATVHIPAMVLALLIHSLINLVLFRATGLHDQLSLDLYRVHITSRVHANIVTYWAIVGIYYAFDYYRSLRDGERQTARLQLQLAQANLRALKMQLHPHFLFNTLNSVAALVRKNENRTAIRMLVQLSDFLRLALENKGLQEIPVHQEVDFVQRYLDIERIRFQERLSVLVDVHPDADGAFVPNMILQPLVENAIHHGIGPNAEAGRIDIAAQRAGDRLRLSVRDNGKGISEAAPSRPGRGVGLSNTSERLRNLYGADQSLTFREADGGGLEVVIDLPFSDRPVIQHADADLT